MYREFIMNKSVMLIISILFIFSSVTISEEQKRTETKKIVVKKRTNTRGIVTTTPSSNWSKIKDLFM